MSRVSVLVVDDEPSFLLALRQSLSSEGFDVATAADGERALELFASRPFDIVLLDVMLPSMSGIDVCRTIRSTADTPIIMVSARSEEVDTVVALEVGADDYITKPYRTRELVARMRSVLRRGRRTSPLTAGRSDGEITSGPVRLDPQRHEVWVRNEKVRMPLKEFQLLSQLMANVGYVVPRHELLDRVWGFDYVGDSKTLDVHIKRLRSKIEADPSNPALIHTVRGVGYKFADQS